MIKPRKSFAHKQLEILQRRMTLSREQENLLKRLENGFVGELLFFNLLQTELQSSPIQLASLELSVNDNDFQIDRLLIFQNEIVLTEIKHFEGDYIIDNNNWYTISRNQISHPLHQLQRTELLLGQLLKQHKISIDIKPYVVFTHPAFHLYEAPVHLPVIFPTQLKRFMQRLNNIPSQMAERHRKIADLLVSSHGASKRRTEIDYNYDSLKKGVTCSECRGFMEVKDRKALQCMMCKRSEHIEKAIMRNVYDFHFLFPEKQITVGEISDWTGDTINKYQIRKSLNKYGELMMHGKSSYYFINQLNNSSGS